MGAACGQLAGFGRSRQVVLSVERFLLVSSILRSSDYVCTLPRRLATRFSDVLDLFELPCEVPPFAFACAWHPRNHHDPASRWLREQVFAVAAEG